MRWCSPCTWVVPEALPTVVENWVLRENKVCQQGQGV
jgi:hypothetical protein